MVEGQLSITVLAVTAISPTIAMPSQTVTLTGTLLSLVTGLVINFPDTSVSVNTFTSQSDTSLSFVLPPHPTDPLFHGQVTIDVYAAVNLLSAVNSDFENGTVGQWAAANATLSNTTAEAHSGTHSLRWTQTTANSSSYGDPYGSGYFIPVTPGGTYIAKGYVKSSVARQCQIGIWWYDSGGTYISGPPPTTVTSSTTAWTPVTASGTAPTNAAHCLPVLVNGSNNVVGIGDVFDWDSISFTAAPFIADTVDLVYKMRPFLLDFTGGPLDGQEQICADVDITNPLTIYSNYGVSRSSGPGRSVWSSYFYASTATLTDPTLAAHYVFDYIPRSTGEHPEGVGIGTRRPPAPVTTPAAPPLTITSAPPPTLTSVNPTSGHTYDPITLTGTGLSGVTRVAFYQGTTFIESITPDAKTATTVAFTVPSPLASYGTTFQISVWNDTTGLQSNSLPFQAFI